MEQLSTHLISSSQCREAHIIVELTHMSRSHSTQWFDKQFSVFSCLHEENKIKQQKEESENMNLN